MATETVVSHQTTTDEQVEEKLNEELKIIQQESVSTPKKSEEDNAKAEELPSLAAPLSKTEEKTEVKLVEESLIPVSPLSETEEKTEAKVIEESPSPDVPLSETGREDRG
ncbi:hypothetical protein L1049_020713 [Liquidambar formosana]|uniref:Uncharacterized protein n=1 Tax=Liquidambar formosana TaxID=63359 RepID=A0AAP0X4I2_LIQFO